MAGMDEAVCSSASLEAVERWFEGNFRERGEIGAAVSVWKDGVEVLSLAGGHLTREAQQPWTPETLVPVWSSTKGMAAWTCLRALDEAGVSLDQTVGALWPDFEQGGKEALSLRQLLSHTGGLAVLDERVSIQDPVAIARALARQRPLGPPGTVQAYHARTFGFLLDEVVRRVSGAAGLGEFFEVKLRRAAAAEFWIGLPREEEGRVATLYPGRMTDGLRADPFMKAFQTAGSVTQRAFQSPVGLNAVADFNQPETWRAGFASMGGVGSARGLASLYARLALRPEAGLEQVESDAEDAVLCRRMAFACGMMKDAMDAGSGVKVRPLFGPSPRAFGHPGAGGSLAFADPQHGIGFAYVMNQMELGVLPGEKALGLVRALYGQDASGSAWESRLAGDR
jgi:CubicO group peptidase (beta-lactamase class C family)